jgi:hypothetical protein
MDTLIKNGNLFIEGTKVFPEVNFNASGDLQITGRIISDHLCEHFLPAFEWIEECTCETVYFEVKLDYLNSNGMFLLLELLRCLENREEIESISVMWYYEEEDDEHFELGEIIREKLKRTQFNYLAYI